MKHLCFALTCEFDFLHCVARSIKRDRGGLHIHPHTILYPHIQHTYLHSHITYHTYMHACCHSIEDDLQLRASERTLTCVLLHADISLLY